MNEKIGIKNYISQADLKESFTVPIGWNITGYFQLTSFAHVLQRWPREREYNISECLCFKITQIWDEYIFP